MIKTDTHKPAHILIEIFALLLLLQGVLALLKHIIVPFVPNTIFNEKMVTMVIMVALTGSDLATLMQRPELDYAQVSQAFPPAEPLESQAAEQVDISLKYAGYIKKQEEQVERFRNLENKRLPEGTDYLQIRGLSVESAQKLNKRQPQSVGQAARISGVSPADINVLLVYLRSRGH